ncbi:hypothetical protein HYR99_12285 [Candidatus Poribacteria bacterium]|nr:hypothetical protein [Candidatus Poribacteria bacterium]
MEHAEVIAKLSHYIDNDLSDAEYLRVEAHLVEGCEACEKKIDELLAEEPQTSRYTDEEILRLLRRGYTLSPTKERELIQRFQGVIADSLRPSRTSALRLVADQGEEREQLEKMKRELGPELAAKRLKLSLSEKTYSGRLEIYDLHSAYFVLEKDGGETSDLDGAEIEFYNQNAPEKRLTERVEEDSVLLDFGKLNLSLRDYERVGFRLSVSGVSIEGSFAEMESK